MQPDEKECSFCAEIIKAKANKCKHCGEMLGGARETNNPPKIKQKEIISEKPKEEKEFFKDKDVLITNTRVIIKGKTYSTANITSVSKSAPANSGLSIGIFMLCIGIIFGLFGFALIKAGSCGVTMLIMGILFFFVGIVGVGTKPQIALQIKSASTEEAALTSENFEYIQTLVDSINKAIMARG